MSLTELDHKVMWHPFTQMAEWEPLVIARGEGSYLIDENGRRYLDGVSSLWCTIHGHNHPQLNRAIHDQVDRLAHSTFLGLTHEPGILLGAELLAMAPRGLSRVFYSDSGSTAVEIALKQSFQYWQLVGKPAKQRFVRLGDAYHGDTLGAVGVGGIDLFHRIFGPLLVQSIAIDSPYRTDGVRSLEQLEIQLREHHGEIAAFIVEPLIQGAAGMLVHPQNFLRSAARLCKQYEVHLIVDEVATGFGRTGTIFACEQEAIEPDFMCVAKGISGGYLPLAATLSTEEIYQAFLGHRAELKQFFHGHTYTANPIACAVARASLRLLVDETLANAGKRIENLEFVLADVRTWDGVVNVRHRGLMIGIELRPGLALQVCDRARDHGAILRPLGDVVVWMPPLSISESEMALLARATEAALHDATCST